MTDESKPTFEDAAAWAAANYHMDADPEGAAELAERLGPNAPNARDCSHGSLRRSCERCEDAARIAELEAEVERLRKERDTERMRANIEMETRYAAELELDSLKQIELASAREAGAREFNETR